MSKTIWKESQGERFNVGEIKEFLKDIPNETEIDLITEYTGRSLACHIEYDGYMVVVYSDELEEE